MHGWWEGAALRVSEHLQGSTRQAVEAFSVFMEKFSERVGVDYCPPRGQIVEPLP